MIKIARKAEIPATNNRVKNPPVPLFDSVLVLYLRDTGYPKMSMFLRPEPTAWKNPFDGFAAFDFIYL